MYYLCRPRHQHSSDPPEDNEQLSLDPPIDDPPAEDDEENEEEPVVEPTAAEIVQAGVAWGQLDNDMTIPVDQQEVDEAEEQLIQQFARDGCKCDFGPNWSPCCTTITVEHYRSVRCQMLELTHDELDLVVMGQVMASCFSGGTSSHRRLERGKSYTMFHHNGMRICQKTFLFLHTMGFGRFKAINASYMVSGVVARVHGNKGRWKKTGLSLKEVQDVIQFIMNYAAMCREREREREREKSMCAWERERDEVQLHMCQFITEHLT